MTGVGCSAGGHGRLQSPGPRSWKEWCHMNPNELSAFRKQLQECQKCFKGAEPKCRHHEDLVGGYDKGKIVFIGINPQGQENNAIYRAIESAAEERRNQLGDEILKMLVDPRVKSKAFADIDFRNHKGLTGWLPRARRILGLSSEELANRMRFPPLTGLVHSSSGWSRSFSSSTLRHALHATVTIPVAGGSAHCVGACSW